MELQSWLLYHLVAVSDCKAASPKPQAQLQKQSCAQNPVARPADRVMQSAGPAAYTAATGEELDRPKASSTTSRARELGLRAQKKLLSRFAASGPGKSLLIDEASSSLLDNLYQLMERAARLGELDKRQPEKVLKNVVKLSIKIGLLQRNQQLANPGDAAHVDELRRALRSAALALLSFYELDFSYDRGYMSQALERCRRAAHALVQPHLTDKSRERVDQVFDFVAHADFLEAVFGQRSAELRPQLAALAADLDRALEAGQL